MVFKAVTLTGSLNRGPSRVLEPEEFLKLLLSRRRLVRIDELGKHGCRLLDKASGEEFNVEEAKLDRYVEKAEVVGSK